MYSDNNNLRKGFLKRAGLAVFALFVFSSSARSVSKENFVNSASSSPVRPPFRVKKAKKAIVRID